MHARSLSWYAVSGSNSRIMVDLADAETGVSLAAVHTALPSVGAGHESSEYSVIAPFGTDGGSQLTSNARGAICVTVGGLMPSGEFDGVDTNACGLFLLPPPAKTVTV